MNKREVVIGVYQHPLIQKILKRHLIESSIINQFIVEEVMENEELVFEASTPKGNLGAKIRNVINRSLGKGIDPKEIAKLIADPNGRFYSGWLTSIQKIEGEKQQQDLKLYMDNFIKNAVEKLQSGNFKISPKEQKNLEALKQKLVQIEDPKKQQLVVTQAVQTGLVTQQQAQELVKDIEAAPQPQLSDGSAESFKKKVVPPDMQSAVESILKSRYFKPYQDAINEADIDQQKTPMLEIEVAFFLALLNMTKASSPEDIEEQVNYDKLESTSANQLTAGVINRVLGKITTALKNAEYDSSRFLKFVDSDSFAKAWEMSFSMMRMDQSTDTDATSTDPEIDDTAQDDTDVDPNTGEEEPIGGGTEIVTSPGSEEQPIEPEEDDPPQETDPEAEPAQTAPQKVGELPFNPAEPMREQEQFLPGIEIFEEASARFADNFMSVPLLKMQQKILVNLISATKSLFDEKEALSRRDKTDREMSPAKEKENTPEPKAELAPTQEGQEEEIAKMQAKGEEIIAKAKKEKPKKKSDFETYKVDRKVLNNIKVDLRYIEKAIAFLAKDPGGLLPKFLGSQSTKHESSKYKQKVVDYTKRLQMKIAQTYKLIASIEGLQEKAAEMSKDQMIDIVEDVWEHVTPELKEIQTLFDEPVSYEIISGKANKVLQLLNPIRPFFPETAKFTPDAKAGSREAVEDFQSVITTFKTEALADIYALLKDQNLDSGRIKKTLLELKMLSDQL